MQVDAVAYWGQKQGCDPREYEDAYAVGAFGDADMWTLSDSSRRLRVAVSDGATESMLSGRWAGVLTKQYTASSRPQMRTSIRRAQDRWPRVLNDYKQAREQACKPIAWYEEPGLERGAHATLLVAEFRARSGSDPGRWTAEAVGDSCLFQVAGNDVACAFPFTEAAQFDTSPALVQTGLRSRRLLDKHCRRVAGSYRGGDTFFLCTDALAAWFLAQAERAAEPWKIWSGFSGAAGAAAFRDWTTAERSAGRLKNDDVTLLIVSMA